MLSLSNLTLKAPEVELAGALVAVGAADENGVNNPAKLNVYADKLRLDKSEVYISNGGGIYTFSGARPEIDSISSKIHPQGDFA